MTKMLFASHVVKIAEKLPIYRSIIERFTGRFIAIYRRFFRWILANTSISKPGFLTGDFSRQNPSGFSRDPSLSDIVDEPEPLVLATSPNSACFSRLSTEYRCRSKNRHRSKNAQSVAELFMLDETEFPECELTFPMAESHFSIN